MADTPDLRALTQSDERPKLSEVSTARLDDLLNTVSSVVAVSCWTRQEVIDEARRRLRELAQTEPSPILPAGVLADIARQAAPYAHLRVGQVWQEMDGRFKRNVTIVAIHGERVRIRSIRTTTASIHRFRNPKGVCGGYMLIRESPEATA